MNLILTAGDPYIDLFVTALDENVGDTITWAVKVS